MLILQDIKRSKKQKQQHILCNSCLRLTLDRDAGMRLITSRAVCLWQLIHVTSTPCCNYNLPTASFWLSTKYTKYTYMESIQLSYSNSGPKYIQHIRARIYSTCVLPILLYGSETWTLIQADWNRLHSFHVRCQRRILHIGWHDFVSNVPMTRFCIIPACSISHTSFIIKRRSSLFSHVARLWSDAQAN